MRANLWIIVEEVVRWGPESLFSFGQSGNRLCWGWKGGKNPEPGSECFWPSPEEKGAEEAELAKILQLKEARAGGTWWLTIRSVKQLKMSPAKWTLVFHGHLLDYLKKPPYLALLISAFALISGAVQAFSVAGGVSQHICRAAAERPMWNYGCLEQSDGFSV